MSRSGGSALIALRVRRVSLGGDVMRSFDFFFCIRDASMPVPGLAMVARGLAPVVKSQPGSRGSHV